MMSRRSGESSGSTGEFATIDCACETTEDSVMECGRPVLSCEVLDDCGEGDCGTWADRGRSPIGSNDTTGLEGEYGEPPASEAESNGGLRAPITTDEVPLDLTECPGDGMGENDIDVPPGDSVASRLDPGE